MKHHVNCCKSVTHPEFRESWCLSAVNCVLSAVRVAIDTRDDLGKGSTRCKGRRESKHVSLPKASATAERNCSSVA